MTLAAYMGKVEPHGLLRVEASGLELHITENACTSNMYGRIKFSSV